MKKWYVNKIYRSECYKGRKILDGLFLSKAHSRQKSRIGNDGLYYEITSNKYFLIRDGFSIESDNEKVNDIFEAIRILRNTFTDCNEKALNRFIKKIGEL